MIAIFIFGYDNKCKNKHRKFFRILIQVMIPGLINEYKIIAVFHRHIMIGIITITTYLVNKPALFHQNCTFVQYVLGLFSIKLYFRTVAKYQMTPDNCKIYEKHK